MQRFCHRAGVGVVGWRQGATAPATATLAPRDNHRRLVARGRHGRAVAGYTTAGVTSATSDLAASYKLLGIVSADASSTYNIRSGAAADSAASYNVRAVVVSDMGANYAILSAGTVQADLVAGYVVRWQVGADLAASYWVSADTVFTARSRSRIGPSQIAAKARIGDLAL